MNTVDPVADLPSERDLPEHWRIREELLARINAEEHAPRALRWLTPLAAAAAVAAIAVAAALVLPAGRAGRPAAASSGLTGPAFAGAPRARLPATYHFSVPAPVSTLVVSDQQGNVTVTGTDSSSVQVTARVSAYTGPALHWTHQLPSRGVGNVGYRLPRWCSADTRTCPEVDFDIRVPRSTAVRVDDGAGNTSLIDLAGPVSVLAQAGDVLMAGLSGAPVAVRDQAGDVRGTALGSRAVSVWDEAGLISLSFATAPAQVLVIDEAGDIALALPPGNAAYRVKASSSAGQVSVAVPNSSSSPRQIRATSEAGDISITR